MATYSDFTWEKILKDLAGLCERGELRLYDARGVQLAGLRFPPNAFEKRPDGCVCAKVVEDDPNAAASGLATEYRVYTKNEELILTGSIGPRGDLKVKDAFVEAGGKVSIGNFTLAPG